MMMLWLHLFGTNEEILAETSKSIYLHDGEPLIFALRKVGRMCVVFYTFLGGYGLAKVYQRTPTTAGLGIASGMNNGKRIWNLFKNYWIVMLLFLITATILHPKTYPGNATEFILNVSALSCTYNDTLWFLFPYVLLTLFAAPIIRLANTLHGMWLWAAIALAFAIKTISYCINIPFYNLGGIICSNILSATGLFFMFFIGALFARDSFMERTVKTVKQSISCSHITKFLHIGTSTVCSIMLFLLFVGRTLMGASTLIDPVYIILMIVTFLCIERPKWLNNCLSYIGKHSTNIWFTHRYLLVLSGTAIAFFKNPVVILAVLIITCIGFSCVINSILKTTKR